MKSSRRGSQIRVHRVQSEPSKSNPEGSLGSLYLGYIVTLNPVNPPFGLLNRTVTEPQHGPAQTTGKDLP